MYEMLGRPRTHGDEERRSDLTQCKNCRFWKPDGATAMLPGTIPARGYGTCQLMHSQMGVPEHPKTLAYAGDHQGHQAMGITSPEYGCVQGEPKPEGPNRVDFKIKGKMNS